MLKFTTMKKKGHALKITKKSPLFETASISFEKHQGYY